MFSIIRNAINVENLNFNKDQKISPKSASLNLTYNIESVRILSKDNLPELNKTVYNFKQYQEILNRTVLTLDGFFSELWLNKIIIKNVGIAPIACKDFYVNDKLGFENIPTIIAVWINSITTKKYIGAKSSIDKNFVNIEFDTIEPNDSIELNIISRRALEYIELKGKTKDFDKPHKFNCNVSNNTKEDNIIPKVIVIVLLLFSALLIILGEYLEYKNLGLYIRNPFVIQEVQKNVK